MPSWDALREFHSFHHETEAVTEQACESPLLSLPAELRIKIWNLSLVPSKILVAGPERPVALRYFTGGEEWAECNDGLSVDVFSYSSLPITKQIYDELLFLLTHSTIWYFTSLQTAWQCMAGKTKEGRTCGFPQSTSVGAYNDMTANKLRRLAIKMEGESSLPMERSTRLQSQLKKMPNLKVLTLSLNFDAFMSQRNSWDNLVTVKDYHSHRTAAAYVSAFTWEGLETKIAVQERNLSKRFMQELERLCGLHNIRVRRVGRDRYAGDLLEIVISGQSSITALNPMPTGLPDL